ncbi:MAG TPA: mercuric transport protein MerTP [Ignavibacteria bacterium]|nr:mercuric transport protein MerTP [Ignavibacteria bacterium]
MVNNKSKKNKWLGVGIFAAGAASICCIVPVLAILGGIGGVASTFSWFQPLRPYFMALSVIALGAAFNQAYKPKKEIECECEPARPGDGNNNKPRFINSKKFLWIILFVSVALYSFPYYSSALFPNVDMTVAMTNSDNIREAKIDIEGMTCSSCENTVDYSLKTTEGVLSATSSYKTGVAKVKYDKTKTSPEQLKKAIEEKAGFKVKDVTELNKKNGEE